MREAKEQDLDFLAQCYVKIGSHMKSGCQDLYIARLPETPDETIRNQMARYVGKEDAVAFIEEVDDRPVACLLGTIGGSSLSPARLGKVGHIAICWVESEHRQTGVARSLVSAAEDWFRKREISIIELSYLAKNELAAIVWRHLGYEPFRVFSFKQL